MYVIKKVEEKQVRLKLNGTNQLLVYADDLNLLGGNTDTTKKNPDTLIYPNIEVGLEVNAEKKLSIYYCLVTRVQGKFIT
jgi:hypothetical protein